MKSVMIAAILLTVSSSCFAQKADECDVLESYKSLDVSKLTSREKKSIADKIDTCIKDTLATIAELQKRSNEVIRNDSQTNAAPN